MRADMGLAKLAWLRAQQLLGLKSPLAERRKLPLPFARVQAARATGVPNEILGATAYGAYGLCERIELLRESACFGGTCFAGLTRRSIGLCSRYASLRFDQAIGFQSVGPGPQCSCDAIVIAAGVLRIEELRKLRGLHDIAHRGEGIFKSVRFAGAISIEARVGTVSVCARRTIEFQQAVLVQYHARWFVPFCCCSRHPEYKRSHCDPSRVHGAQTASS